MELEEEQAVQYIKIDLATYVIGNIQDHYNLKSISITSLITCHA